MRYTNDELNYELKNLLLDVYYGLEYLDSLDVVEAAMMIEEVFDVEISDELIERFMNGRHEVQFDDVVKFLVEQTQSQLNS